MYNFFLNYTLLFFLILWFILIFLLTNSENVTNSQEMSVFSCMTILNYVNMLQIVLVGVDELIVLNDYKLICVCWKLLIHFI